MSPGAVEDLYSRAIVGWAVGSRIDSRLVADALEVAVARRCPGEGPVAHSDRGGRYASGHRRRDHAPVESVFASPKKGLVHRERYRTRAEARASASGPVGAFDDRVRRHSAPGYQSPAGYEQAARPPTPCLFSVGKFTSAGIV